MFNKITLFLLITTSGASLLASERDGLRGGTGDSHSPPRGNSSVALAVRHGDTGGDSVVVDILNPLGGGDAGSMVAAAGAGGARKVIRTKRGKKDRSKFCLDCAECGSCCDSCTAKVRTGCAETGKFLGRVACCRTAPFEKLDSWMTDCPRLRALVDLGVCSGVALSASQLLPETTISIFGTHLLGRSICRNMGEVPDSIMSTSAGLVLAGAFATGAYYLEAYGPLAGFTLGLTNSISLSGFEKIDNIFSGYVKNKD